jgi:predicted ribonuclease YlaK
MLAIHLIESGKYDRLVILFNPTKTRGSTEMGYYSGSLIEKAMSSSIGNILTTKFGDRFAVDLLLQQNKIRLIPMSDCRGMEINDNEILFITECQNTSIDLLKLCLSRASQGCKIFLEGDYHTQVDDRCFENSNNGMKRAIDVLKGEDIFGYVELKNVYRSKIASLVEKL